MGEISAFGRSPIITNKEKPSLKPGGAGQGAAESLCTQEIKYKSYIHFFQWLSVLFILEENYKNTFFVFTLRWFKLWERLPSAVQMPLSDSAVIHLQGKSPLKSINSTSINKQKIIFDR